MIEDPVLRQRLSFRRPSEDVLVVDIWIDPGGGVTPHVHPAMEERFTVVEGRASFLSGRKWRTAGAGETVVVPPGVRHAYRNKGDAPAHVVCEARPPSSLQEFLEEIAALGRQRAFTRSGLPRTPRGLVRAAAVLNKHREMATLGFPPMPPAPLQRVLLPALARLGRQ
jgi:quercetin dioxygenase-like cupin family protein